jgi:uncharacterized protein with HEPN domain
MQPDERLRLLKYLQDALSAAEEIQKFTFGANENDFDNNNIKWFVERGIEILSEALKRAKVVQPSLKITDLAKIFATRNKIAHEYDVVDPLQIYTIAIKNIPVVVKELKLIINNIETRNG